MQHDCVIVPGLGGFITQYKPAVEDMPGKKLLPPSRTISFNRQLQQNDGMLIHHIAAKANMPYKTAEEKVEQFVQACKRHLTIRGIVVIPEIGKLYNDQHGNLNFAPSSTGRNYLPEAYGLQPVSWYKTYVEKLVEALKEEQEPIVAPLPAINNQKAKRRARYRNGVVTSIALVGVFLVLIAQGVYIKPLQLNTLSLFSFDTVMPFLETPVAAPNNASTVTLKSGAHPTPTLMPEMEITRFHDSSIDEGYYLILGSFNNLEKAEHYKQRQQLDNELLILDSGSGNYRIATYVTTNTTQALASLNQFRTHYRPDVWLLYNNRWQMSDYR